MHIVLFEPEIPPNTGNIIRLCANTGARLHLIEPFGFELDDKRLRRAGLDYAEFSRVRKYKKWSIFIQTLAKNAVVYAMTTKGSKSLFDVKLEAEPYFVFGPETRGLPDHILNDFSADSRLRIPMKDNSRSLNLSNSAAITAYEALRQSGFSNLR